MIKTNYSDLPELFMVEDDGVVIYNFDLIEIDPKNEDEKKSYQALAIRLNEPFSENNLLLQVINAICGEGVEAKMLNDFQAAQFGILPDSYVERYKEFLKQRLEVKIKVQKDYEVFRKIEA